MIIEIVEKNFHLILHNFFVVTSNLQQLADISQVRSDFFLKK